MATENKDLPAFASIAVYGYDVYQQHGLTKREYFAAMAMQSIDTRAYAKQYGREWANWAAFDSVEMADALLKALDKK